MERMQEVQTQNLAQEGSLNRKEIAIRLRQKSIDVDYEDWDGLSDEDVVERVWSIVFIRGGIDFEEIITDKELEPFMEYPYEV